MTKRHIVLGFVLSVAIASSVSTQTKTPPPLPSITPVSLPTTFNVPTPGYVIEQWVAEGNTPKMRAHGWDIWTAMTQPSGQTYPLVNRALPVWDTWQSDNELFNTPTSISASGSSAARKAPLHPFHRARQQTHHLAPNLQPTNEIAISFNKFDPTAARYILSEQSTPYSGTTTFPINNQAGVANLNATWPQDTPVGRRAIKDFPLTAIETKPVFFPVVQNTLTPVPLWRGPGQSNNPQNPTPATWNTCVLVDATQTATTGLTTATPTQITGAQKVPGYNCSNYLYAPIGLYYAVQLDANGAAVFNAFQGVGLSSVVAGDYAVLVAMHVNTKEISRWTWQTFYWQGSSQYDPAFPGTLGDVPASVAAPWSNYAMCTAYDQVIAGKRVTCFNPYLETSPFIPDGINSNCVSCHGMASVGGTSSQPTTANYPPTYTDNNVFKIPVDFSAALLFGSRTKTDFSWAVGGGGSGD